MIINFMNSDELKKIHDLSFSFRFSDKYQNELFLRLNKYEFIYPLNLLDSSELKRRLLHYKIPSFIASVFINFLKIFIYVINFCKIISFFYGKKIDILHINNGNYPGAISCNSAVLAGKILGIKKIIYTVNNIPIPYRSLSRVIDFPIDFITFNLVTCFITASNYARDKLSKLIPSVHKNRFVSIHNGITLRSINESNIQLKKRLELNDEDIVVSIIAVLEKRKGHLYLLHAIDYLRKNAAPILNKIIFIVEGEGKEFDALKQFANDNKIEKYLKFIGREKNIFNLINGSDIIVLPSISNEDFPNIILEAMSLGKPVIASNISGIIEQIEHMKTGIIVESKNYLSIAEALIFLINNSDIREKMGKNAKIRFEKYFEAKVAIRKYMNLYENIKNYQNF
ncbi:glycosyltransferase family 4 protein [Fluviispira vulneris]|uniref:glycosyltransferase family 4 protein n=1 Tax=Fluviispira vulneris TaxID=2763012 RepID=UPI0016469BE9|nr:glycosyltransferase family 4 protein [Fluviispira vulneris]